MALFAGTKVQDSAAGRAAQDLLAALKSSLSPSVSTGEVFANLLSETQASLPDIKPRETSSGAADAASRREQESGSADPSEAQKAEKPAAQAGSEAKKVENKPAHKTTEKEDDKKNEASEEGEKLQTEDMQGQETVVEEAGKSEEKEKKKTISSDEEEILNLLAGLGPFEKTENVQETGGDAQQPVTGASETELENQEITSEAEKATLMAMAQMEAAARLHGAKTKGKENGEKTPSEAERPSDEGQDQENVLLSQLELTEEKAPKDEGAKDQTLAADQETEPSALQEALDQTGDKGKRIESSFSSAALKEVKPAQTETPQPQATTTTASAVLMAQVLAEQASSQAGANGAAKVETLSNASPSAKGAMPAPVMGEGGRTVGSYDFASQLSAARVTRGGATGLPQPVEQVALQLHKAVKQGQTEMTIQLRPGELGKVEITLTFLEDNKVQGTVVAEKASTLSLLQKDSDLLQRALQEAGLQTDSGCLEFSLQGEGRPQSSAQDLSGENGKGKTVRFSALDVANDDSGIDTAGTEAEVYYVTPGRVNLRV